MVCPENYVRMVFVSLCVRVNRERVCSIAAAVAGSVVWCITIHDDGDDADDDDDDGDDEDDDDDHDDPGYC